MNGFEPLRRRIIDYTEVGQWSEVYDGPLEDCESEKLKAENAKLRELCADLLKGFDCGWPSDVCGDCERDGTGMPIGGCKLENRARELGVEVDA